MPTTLVPDETAVEALAASLGISGATARAALLLDGVAPSWHDMINLDTLNMASCSDCILGQLVAKYPDFAECALYSPVASFDAALVKLDGVVGFEAHLPSRYNFSYGNNEYATLITARRELIGASE